MATLRATAGRTLSRLVAPFAGAVAERARLDEAQAILDACAGVGRNVRLRMPVVVYGAESLTFGDDVEVGEFVVLRAHGGLRIGDRVLIAAHAIVTTRGHPEELPRRGLAVDAPIAIEDDVWIGANATVLPGVTIGRGAIVAAGAVVTDSVEPMTVVGGVPARLIRRIEAGA
jgi:galactoside O-acetyltransferase